MNAQKYNELSDVKHRAAMVAYYLSQGLPEQQIGILLFPKDKSSTANSKVTRAKQYALRKGWLKIAFMEDRFDMPVLNDLRESAHHHDWLELEAELISLSGGVLKNLQVFYSGDKAEPEKPIEWDEQIERFAANSAWHIHELLKRSKTGVAAGWGTTVAIAVEAIAARLGGTVNLKQNGRNKIEVVPTAGDPLGKPIKVRETSSTSLAMKLSEILNGPGKRVCSLKNIQPVLDARYKDNNEKREVVMEYIRGQGDYGNIFGDNHGPNTLIGKVDTILTSAGVFHSEHGLKNELITIGGVPESDLTKLFAGDIGGVLVAKEEIERDSQAKTTFDQISRLWTGVWLSDYERVAREAAKCNNTDCPAGCVLLAIGAIKAQIILDLTVRLRVVNSLLINISLANELKKLLEQRRKKR